MLLRAARSTSWAALICAALPAWATWRVAASTWCTRSRSSTRSVSNDSAASSHGAAGPAVGGRTPLVSEREGAAPRFGRDRLDQALVLELLKGRVDGARAGRPVAVAPLGDDLDDLVAVHRLLGEEREDGGADISAAGTTAGAERPAEAARAVAVATAAAPRPVTGHEPDVPRTVIATAAPFESDCRHVSVPFYRVPSRYIVSMSLVKSDNRPGG